MKRLYVLVEGQTEEAFVNRLIAPHLVNYQLAVSALLVKNRSDAWERRFKGGFRKYFKIEEHLLTLWKQVGGSDCWFTTLLDLYGLPDDFPGLAKSAGLSDPYKKVQQLEAAFL
jgi:hypothetical protein